MVKAVWGEPRKKRGSDNPTRRLFAPRPASWAPVVRGEADASGGLWWRKGDDFGTIIPMNRKGVPKQVREKVLAEFNHRCSICGQDKPHIHHIDGDPSNNSEENLIPLCPNHHLIDQHAPTQKTDQRKLRLFRQFKDPTILTPQFEALFRRLLFLLELEESSFDVNVALEAAGELQSFVSALEMGSFYGARIGTLVATPPVTDSLTWGEEDSALRFKKRRKKYFERLVENRGDVIILVIELLRFQKWSFDPTQSIT